MNRQEVTEYIDRTVEKTGKTRSAVCSQKYYMQHLEEQRRKGKTGHVK